MSREGEYNIRFRHELGDIGPLTFTKDSTVLQVIPLIINPVNPYRPSVLGEGEINGGVAK